MSRYLHQHVKIHIFRKSLIYREACSGSWAVPLSAPITTQKRPAPATCGHRSAATLSGKPTAPASCPDKPAPPRLSTQSAEDPCPRGVVKAFWLKQTRHTILHLTLGVRKARLSQYLRSQISNLHSRPILPDHELQPSLCSS